MNRQKERIRDSQLKYKHGLGQNFIYDEALLETLASLSGVTGEDDVLEIGPGAGSLTKHLCARAHAVLALEVDERLIPLLEAFMTGTNNLTVVHGDVMKANLPELTASMRHPFHVVANIPYYITTPLISMLLAGNLPIASMALMVQREVADKLLSGPGEEGWGPLAVRCQTRCEPRLALEVPASCFTPPPKVDSAFVVMPVRARPAVEPLDWSDYDRVVAAAFSLRRKTLVNALMATLRMERAQAVLLTETAGLDPMIRGERLSIEAFARLSDAYTRTKETKI